MVGNIFLIGQLRELRLELLNNWLKTTQLVSAESGLEPLSVLSTSQAHMRRKG